MVSGSAIATLVLFILSIILVIQPVAIPIPFLRRKRHFPFNLTTAPIIAIAILWAAQCLGPREVRSRPSAILTELLTKRLKIQQGIVCVF